MKKIVLASSSPRRIETLQKLHIPFSQINPPFDEVIPKNMSHSNIPEYFAQKKALSVVSLIEDKEETLVLGLDTIVVHNNILYGKPKNIAEARNTLKNLSNTHHSVITGIAIYNTKTKKIISKTSVSQIKVKKLTETDINWYLSKNEWQDAAGAYKIQGFFQRYVFSLEGSFSSILGLPIFEFYDIMSSHGYEFS